MFYYPAVLKRHTGCFSTIWLVATKGIKVTRRDFLKVNVKSTCDDIMNYVLERVPPPQPGLPRPRFSLYLSSQLQYGVILVYHRQCAFLLEELQSVLGKLVKQSATQKIDMDEHSRSTQDFPDALSLLEEAEGAPDPLFGVMFMGVAMPSPNTMIQRGREYLRETSPQLSELSSPAAAAAAAAALESAITASPDAITLREREPIAIPVAEFEGKELVDQHPDTIEILMAQTDDFPEGGDLEMQTEGVSPRDQEREMERGGGEEDLEKKTTKDLTSSTIESQPTSVSTEDVMLPQEELGLSVEKPGAPSDQHTPVSVSIPPSPPSPAQERQRPTLQTEDEPSPEAKRRKRRKRQLIFFDPETQITQDVQQQQMDNPLIETRPPLLSPAPSQRTLSAAELLNNPWTPLPEELLFLWKQAATIKPVSGSDLQAGERGPESTDSEREREREAAEPGEREEEGLDLTPKEVPRDVAEPEMYDFSDHGSLLLEDPNQREGTREISPMYTSEREGSVVSRSLQDIPEVVDKFLETAAAESPGLQIDFPEKEGAPVVFASLLPPDVDRRTVSNTFLRLLDNLSARRVRAEQDQPYGDILIFTGPNYEEVHPTL